jgi:hypothetical protein
MVRIIPVLFFVLVSSDALAWSEHHLITRAALDQVSELRDRTLKPVPVSRLVSQLGFTSLREFNQSIQIKKDYPFEFKAGENPAKEISALDVLAVYSDEPDWGMDQELFDDGQYPELWRPEYSMMGGKRGVPSQAFRHMYWREWSPLQPLKTFRLPLGKLLEPMGQAGERARIFIELARRAREKGEEYWALRFTANALHYLEDVSSLFHSTQTPSKRFVLMPLFNKQGRGFKGFVGQVTQVVSYYHFAFEDYIGYLMKEHFQGKPSAESNQFVGALNASADEYDDLRYKDSDVRRLVVNMASYSLDGSSEAARASLSFFPAIQTPYDQFEPRKFMDEKWWLDTLQRGRAESEDKRRYFELVREVFVPQGYAIRALVRSELPKN